MKTLKKINIFAFLILILSCDNRTNIKILRDEYLPRSIEGKIIEIELWRGSILSLTLKNSSTEKKISIHTDYEILMQIKSGDYFKKFANSNKCFIKRGDSIIYIDCTQLSDEERDSLGNIQEWKPQEKNKWELNKN